MRSLACASLALGIVLAAASVGLAAAGPTNLLPNPSFEQGRERPQGWLKFGTARCGWDFGGEDGERCVSVTGDGATAGWWYVIGGRPVRRNGLYRLSYWIRVVAEDPKQAVGVLVGLDHLHLATSAGERWERKQAYFRAPSLPELGPRFGQKSLKGAVYFDNVSLQPAIAVHRSAGAGEVMALGRGERIQAGRYTAEHRLDEEGTNDRRFLDRYTAFYDGNRWLFEDQDEVVYHHEVAQLGVDALPPEHRSIAVEVEVGECRGGALRVEFSRNGRTWLPVGLVQESGKTRLEVPEEYMQVVSPWIRLRSAIAGRVEIKSYRYTSTVAGGRDFDGIEGRSHYLAVVYQDPSLEVAVEDLSDLAPGGHSEAGLRVTNGGERRNVEMVAAVEREGKEVARSEEKAWLAPGSSHRFHLGVEIGDAGGQTLRILARDAASGRLLFMLEGEI